MTADNPPPLRVEQALKLLPDVDALTPLRAFVVASSWVRRPSGPHATVGKRYVQPADLLELVPRAVAQVSEHLTGLYEAAIEAMQAEQDGDPARAVRALQRAGDREAQVGRRQQAHRWYEQALRIAEGLHDRRPEIDTLIRLGELEARQDRHDSAARHYQRGLVLAEAEQEHESVTRACDGLGQAALAREQWDGAGAWYARGLQHADGDSRLAARLHLGEGEAALGRGDYDAAAEAVRRSRELSAEANDRVGLARSLHILGRLRAAQGRHEEALSAYTEALARLRPDASSPALEVEIRLDICRLYLDWDRLADADSEARRTEERAIVHNLTRSLARLYVVMGRVRGREHDDAGFVFFEKAIELCRGAEPAPRLEAEVYREYGRFRGRLGDRDEARAYLERAREILDAAGDSGAIAALDAELADVRSARDGTGTPRGA